VVGPSTGDRTTFDLVIDPLVGSFEAVTKTGGWLPVESGLDEGVVTAATIHSFGSIQVVASLELHVPNLLGDIDKLVDADHLGAANVDRIGKVTVKKHLGAVNAVRDVHETASLVTGAPDFDLMLAGDLCKATLRQTAAGAFSRPPSHVPCGPYTL